MEIFKRENIILKDDSMWLQNPRIYGPISILIAGVLVYTVDVTLEPLSVFYSEISSEISAETVAIENALFVLITGFLGLIFASRCNLPWWWRPGDGSPDAKRTSTTVLILGVALVVANTVINVAYRNRGLLGASSLTPEVALALGFHAAIVEEIGFRLFLFSIGVWAANYVLHSRDGAIAIGALVSTLLFALFHPGSGNVLAFVLGFVILYIYYQRGLIPAMVVHFLADAIPFTLTSIM